MSKVRKFSTGVTAGQGTAQLKSQPEDQTPRESVANRVSDLAPEKVASVVATAPIKIASDHNGSKKPGNPRPRRYKNKTYSLLQEDIDIIEALLVEVRQGGLYERGRGDIVRAGVRLLADLSPAEKLKAIEAVENLKS